MSRYVCVCEQIATDYCGDKAAVNNVVVRYMQIS